jgi:hypothetical protein
MKMCNAPTNAALRCIINAKYGGIHSLIGGEWCGFGLIRCRCRSEVVYGRQNY